MTRIRLEFIHEYADRHGKLRRYVRRPGFKRVTLPGLPGSAEFMAAYEAAISGALPARKSKHPPGSAGALVLDFYGSAEFANLKPASQRAYRLVLEQFAVKDGHRLTRDLPKEKARKIVEEIGASRPGMANLVRSVLMRLMSYAIKRGLRDTNPFLAVTPYKLGSHRTWTEAELAAYEGRWPVGSRQRLAYDLLLYLCQRVGDTVRMRRSDIAAGAITLKQDKTGTELTIAIHPALAHSIAKGPKLGIFLIGNERDGRPIDSQTLSLMIKEAAAAAGLPSKCLAHGLRKAGCRRMAEHGSTGKQIAAVSGHKTLKEIERYTAAAEQSGLARAAIAKLPGRKK